MRRSSLEWLCFFIAVVQRGASLAALSSLPDALAPAQWRATGNAKRDALVRCVRKQRIEGAADGFAAAEMRRASPRLEKRATACRLLRTLRVARRSEQD
jgi:hypothetical protein